MSFLAPLYALAALAISLPILFHLVRKRPKNRQTFSSLMFLEAAPPRLTQQSRIENWFLLMLRAIAIGLLAIAFSRPYWNFSSQTEVDASGKRIVFLVDCSASMRRDGLIETAKLRAELLIQKMNDTDSIAVYAFDRTLRPLLSTDMANDAIPSQRKRLAIEAVKKAEPTWDLTDLGSALVQTADLLQTELDPDSNSAHVVNEIVVVTDFQAGMKLDKLANYAWPTNCKVSIERIEAKQLDNVRATLLDKALAFDDESENVDDTKKIRAKVTNSIVSSRSDFVLAWRNEKGEIEGGETRCNVPAGSSLVVSLPIPSAAVSYLEVSGDSTDFDNKYYLATQKPVPSNLVVIESKSLESEASLGYFAAQVPLSNARRIVNSETREPNESTDWPSPVQTPLIIAGANLQEKDFSGLVTYMDQGGHVFWVWDQSIAKNSEVTSDRYGDGLVRLANVSAKISEASVKSYSMLERIDFKHPLLVDLADSRFNDFTKIRFWSHRKLALDDASAWQVLATFDDGFPALLATERGKGKLWVLTSGWQPTQSQFALSSKFVPILTSLFRLAANDFNEATSYTVGDEIQWTTSERIVDPTGNDLQDGQSHSESTDRRGILKEPGIHVRVSESSFPFAVNLPESESLVAPADLESIERLGVNLADQTSPERKVDIQRQLRAFELEAQQGWWRWLVMGVLSVAGIESIVCIMRSRTI